MLVVAPSSVWSLPVRGAWIEISLSEWQALDAAASLPVRGAWIEIHPPYLAGSSFLRSLPVRGAWIEMFRSLSRGLDSQSLPVRGAWIEIPYFVSEVVST